MLFSPCCSGVSAFCLFILGFRGMNHILITAMIASANIIQAITTTVLMVIRS